jgi:hypothetical protein
MAVLLLMTVVMLRLSAWRCGLDHRGLFQLKMMVVLRYDGWRLKFAVNHRAPMELRSGLVWSLKV